MNCDFCASAWPAWVYVIPAGFLPPIERNGVKVDQLDDGRWNACDECAALIDKGDVHALVKRVIAELVAIGTPGLHNREGRRFYTRTVTASYQAILSYPLQKEAYA